MSLRVSGKNLDIGEALRGHIEARIEDALGKYFDGGHTGHVTVEREGSGFRTDCAIHLDTGIVLEAAGRDADARASFDAAADRIEKRLRRYKRRLKDHHHGGKGGELEPASSYVLADFDEDAEVAADYSPTIIAEETTKLETLTVGGAVIAMDLADAPVVVFRHAVHGGINVVYRRRDGHIGWIDPSRSGSHKTSGR
jgi:ribosomal subunit interface protein